MFLLDVTVFLFPPKKEKNMKKENHKVLLAPL
jgi:hypothetical protein